MADYERGSMKIDDQKTAYAGFIKASVVSTVLVTGLLIVMALTLV